MRHAVWVRSVRGGAGWVLATAAVLAGCGGGGGGTAPPVVNPPPPVVNPPPPKPLIRVGPQPAGVACPSGGSQIAAGLDANADSVLQDVEITSTQTICNGSPGVAGLVRTQLEPTGSNCAHAGFAILSGKDGNGNGQLDDVEIDSRAYVCNGAPSQGQPASVTQEAMAIRMELPGDACPYGGNRVTSGKDIDGNGALDNSEVTSTQYVCNGPPATLTWVPLRDRIASDTFPNSAYSATPYSTVEIWLPPTQRLTVGDQFRVVGGGIGSWTLRQSGNQRIHVGTLPQAVGGQWIDSLALRSRGTVKSSADGQRLLAASDDEGDGLGGKLYVSANGGSSWATTSLRLHYPQIAMSEDGRTMMAGSRYSSADGESALYLSIDGGETWRPQPALGVSHWSGLSVSPDGSHLIAAAYTGFGFFFSHPLWVSTDSGATWTAGAWTSQGRSWDAVAQSADGQRMYAGQTQSFCRSTDAGTNWTCDWYSDILDWQNLAVSPDGMQAIAAVQSLSGAPIYPVFASTDGCLSWTQRDLGGIFSPSAVAMPTQRPNTVFISTWQGELLTSTDLGLTWSMQNNVPNWISSGGSTPRISSIDVNADGSQLVAIGGGDRSVGMHVSFSKVVPWTTPGSGHGLNGSRDAAITLQYLGNDEFGIVTYTDQPTPF